MNAAERKNGWQNQLPDYYYSSNLLNAIFDAWAAEFQANQIAQDDVADQLRIDTATWALVYWEAEYDVTGDVSETYESRRARVKTRMSALETFTPQEGQRLANVYSRAKTAKLIRLNGRYRYKTRHDLDDLISYSGLKEAFLQMAPAHLRHIVGLYASDDFSEKHSLRTLIRVAAGEAYHDILYLDGTWRLDGTHRLNGINELFPEHDNLRIRVYNFGTLISDETV